LKGRGEGQNTSRVWNSARCVPYSHSKRNSIRRPSYDAPSRIQQKRTSSWSQNDKKSWGHRHSDLQGQLRIARATKTNSVSHLRSIKVDIDIDNFILLNSNVKRNGQWHPWASWNLQLYPYMQDTYGGNRRILRRAEHTETFRR
jgi:hypothetical protein